MWKRMVLFTFLVICGCAPTITYKTETTPWKDVAGQVIDNKHIQIDIFDINNSKFKRRIIVLENYYKANDKIIVETRKSFTVKCTGTYCEPLNDDKIEYRLVEHSILK